MLQKITQLSIAIALGAALLPAAPVSAQSPYLTGSVTETGSAARQPGLTRGKDINQGADPFSGKDDTGMEALDAPKEAFQQMKQQPAFNMGAQTNGNPYAMPIQPMADQMPQQQMPPQQQMVQQNNDPDGNNAQMQLQWDMWHKRVAEAIYTRFNFFAKAAFQHSGPMLCQLKYVVTRDGHIQAMEMQQKSPNVLYNVLVFQAVKSLDGDMQLLQFPQGSRRQFVQKFGTFAQNYGANGFKYTVGDQERIR